ncbi:MAG: hypothetical protein BGO82_05615 [Devosia sp. 67-54]|uniref:hypothetical protein n=1 Tax=unclassified Devosia TaxID=196773 RepID=UPI00095CEAFD|nr:MULTISPECIES: hypothetical protein [unclassified Devosia]MBN9306907.1 hypothetical protein [Devosia sp.]OJX16997.1 MAG: hypothetical protein BGO82_05615 [Devosia sp. 67-54]
MLQRVTAHLLDNVLPAAADYFGAEQELSAAYAASGQQLPACEREAKKARRLAANAAIALDGLVDRTANELGLSTSTVRAQVGPLCILGSSPRAGCIERVRAVADAYKHDELSNPQHPITSNDDVLVVAPGYGIDGFGVGKMGGVEVAVHQDNGDLRKFLGDVPAAVRGWLQFLSNNGAVLPPNSVSVCNVKVWP